MAKFLNTSATTYHLEELIKSAKERLYLISPYLRVNERIRELLEDRDRYKLDIRIVYGKNELQPEENNWLKSLAFVRTSFCKNLHAKCYVNESVAIITSMNLYEFSQVNNNEMGILINREQDPELYRETYEEAQRLIRISEEIRVSVEKVEKPEAPVERAAASAPPSAKEVKLISTSQLSKALGIASKDLFAQLAKRNWIVRDGEGWVITALGKQQGGQMRRSQQYGEYVVWPEDLRV